MSCARRRLSNTRSKSDPPKAQSFGGSALSCAPAAAPAFFRICAGSSPRLGGLLNLACKSVQAIVILLWNLASPSAQGVSRFCSRPTRAASCFFDRLDLSNRKHVYPVRIIIKETPSNWSKATAILDTIKAKNGTDSVDTVSGAVTAGDLAEVGGLVFLAAGQYQNTNTRLRRARLGAAH